MKEFFVTFRTLRLTGSRKEEERKSQLGERVKGEPYLLVAPPLQVRKGENRQCFHFGFCLESHVHVQRISLVTSSSFRREGAPLSEKKPAFFWRGGGSYFRIDFCGSRSILSYYGSSAPTSFLWQLGFWAAHSSRRQSVEKLKSRAEETPPIIICLETHFLSAK